MSEQTPTTNEPDSGAETPQAAQAAQAAGAESAAQPATAEGAQQPSIPASEVADVFRDIASAGERGLKIMEGAPAPAAAAGNGAAAGDGGPPAADETTGRKFSAELGDVDLRKMIGGPLQAAVDAQLASSIATVDFINAVGFSGEAPNRKPVMVDFSHEREDSTTEPPTKKSVKLNVPLLAMLQVPSMRLQQVVTDFNVRLNSVEKAEVSSQLGIQAEVKGGWGPVNFKVSASYQRKTATSVEVQREYTLKVNVTAVQDEIPPGLEKVLGMLAA